LRQRQNNVFCSQWAYFIMSVTLHPYLLKSSRTYLEHNAWAAFNDQFKQTYCTHHSAVRATRASLLYYWAPQLQDTISLQRQSLEPTSPTPTAPSPGPSARMSMQHLRINACHLALPTPTTAMTPTVSKLDPIGPSVRTLAFWLVYPLKPVIPNTSRDPFFSSPSPFLPWLFSPSCNSLYSYLNTLHAEHRGRFSENKVRKK